MSASQDCNLVISASDNSLYHFGQSNTYRSAEEALEDEYQSDDDNFLNDSGGIDEGLKTHQTYFKKINADGTEFPAAYVSIGPQHFIATDL